MNFKANYILPLGVLAAALFSSCKNDVDVLAPYKQSVAVYGLINPNEAVQKIRINKVYLGEGDATVMAQNADSINFKPGEIVAKLERFVDGIQKPTTVGQSKLSIVLTETVVTTNPGLFNTTQRLYITTDKLYNTGNYRLTVTSASSEKTFVSETLVVDSVHPGNIKPISFSATQPAHPFPAGTQQSAYIDLTSTNILQRIRFKSMANVRLYNVIMRFHYTDSLLDNTTVERYADYTFNTIKSSTLAGGEDMELTFMGEDFYVNLANQISKAPAVTNLKNRVSGYMEYFIYGGSQTLSDFLQVNAPSNSIAQDKGYYTNISDGVGIFACRSRFSIGKDLASGFIDAIATNHYTCPLRFCNSLGSSNNACQ